jgi:hypothetical protein
MMGWPSPTATNSNGDRMVLVVDYATGDDTAAVLAVVQNQGRFVRIVPTIAVTNLPVLETIRERFLRTMAAQEADRQRALRRLYAARASRWLQVAPRPGIVTSQFDSGAEKAPAPFGFEQRQRWGTRRGNRKAPYVPRRLRNVTCAS